MCQSSVEGPSGSVRGFGVMGGQSDVPRLFAEFCLAPERYRCMQHDNSVERVYAACVKLLAEPLPA